MEKNTNENETISIPFIVHEAALSRIERINKRLWILCIVIFIACIVSNFCWIIYENQWQDEVVTIDAVQRGNDVNIVGGGDVNYESESKDNKEKKSP